MEDTIRLVPDARGWRPRFIACLDREEKGDTQDRREGGKRKKEEGRKKERRKEGRKGEARGDG